MGWQVDPALAGVPTYLGPRVIIHPTALAREATHLEGLGVADPFATLTVHPDALVSTFFHQSLNRLREVARLYAAEDERAASGA